MKQVVSLSGGKDSTAMLLMMIEQGEQIDDIVFFDWGMEFPQMYDHLEKLESYIGRPITRLYPPNRFEYYMFDIVKTRGSRKGQKGYGWAHFKRRWCSRIKTDTCNQYIGNRINCIGMAYEERFTRSKPQNRWQAQYGVVPRYPLLEWGVSETSALEYCYSKSFDWGGLYKTFKRVSCWCCPLQNKKGLLALKQNFPELWHRLLELDSKTLYPHPQKELLERLTMVKK